MFDGIRKEDLELFAIKYRDLLSEAISHKLALENTWANLLKAIEKQKKEIVDSLVPNMEIEVLQKLNSEFTYMNLKFENKSSWFGFKSKTILKGNFTIDEIKNKVLNDINFIKHYTEDLKSDLEKIKELNYDIVEVNKKINSITIKLNLIYKSDLTKLASYNDVKLTKALITLTKIEDDLLINLEYLKIRKDFPEDENPRLMELWLWYMLFTSVEAQDAVIHEVDLLNENFLSQSDEKIDIDNILSQNKHEEPINNNEINSFKKVDSFDGYESNKNNDFNDNYVSNASSSVCGD